MHSGFHKYIVYLFPVSMYLTHVNVVSNLRDCRCDLYRTHRNGEILLLVIIDTGRLHLQPFILRLDIRHVFLLKHRMGTGWRERVAECTVDECGHAEAGEKRHFVYVRRCDRDSATG